MVDDEPRFMLAIQYQDVSTNNYKKHNEGQKIQNRYMQEMPSENLN